MYQTHKTQTHIPQNVGIVRMAGKGWVVNYWIPTSTSVKSDCAMWGRELFVQKVCKCSIVLGQTYRPDHSHYNAHHPTNYDVNFSVLNTKTVSECIILYSLFIYKYICVKNTKCLLGLCMLAIMSILRFTYAENYVWITAQQTEYGSTCSPMLRIMSELLLNKRSMVLGSTYTYNSFMVTDHTNWN